LYRLMYEKIARLRSLRWLAAGRARAEDA